MFATIGPRTRVFAQTRQYHWRVVLHRPRIPRSPRTRTARRRCAKFSTLVPVLAIPQARFHCPRAALVLNADLLVWALVALAAFLLAVWWYVALVMRGDTGLVSRKRRNTRVRHARWLINLVQRMAPVASRSLVVVTNIVAVAVFCAAVRSVRRAHHRRGF